MNAERPYVDYYHILQVDPDCDAKTLESAYHDLLKTCHPDHTGTADTTRFNAVIEAYRVLRNPGQRAKYDIRYRQNNPDHGSQSEPGDGADIDEETALDDADDHARILMYLYKKRRENAQNAGVVAYYLQTMLNCSDEHFEFHKWYLKEKGYILVTEHGTLAITVQGIDHVISTSRTMRAEKLLIAQSKDSQD